MLFRQIIFFGFFAASILVIAKGMYSKKHRRRIKGGKRLTYQQADDLEMTRMDRMTLNAIAEHYRENSSQMEQHLAAATGSTPQYAAHNMFNPKPVRFEDVGPTKEYLDYFVYQNPNPDTAAQISICELRNNVGQYDLSYTDLMRMNPEQFPDDLRMRWYIAMLHVLIMTGRTKYAAKVFADAQIFAESYLQTNPASLLPYMNHAATVCALTGDFEESYQYCLAMVAYTQNNQTLGVESFLPALANIKRLFLQGNGGLAMLEYSRLSEQIDAFTQFRYQWERSFWHARLEETRMFEVSPADAQDSMSMPEL